MIDKTYHAEWKCHTPRLLEEILNNPGAGILLRPIQLFGIMLASVAQRAAELDDPILNKLMCQLTLYEIADPESKEYNKEVVARLYKEANEFVNSSLYKKQHSGDASIG